ncbi:MAG: C2 family cysteine protease [Deltaproteobacteria bacterium]|jgi:Ca2+-binding RTX toxin-like protein
MNRRTTTGAALVLMVGLAAPAVAQSSSVGTVTNGTLLIYGSQDADSVSVETRYGDLWVWSGRTLATFPMNGVNRIQFSGSSGDDYFANFTSIPCEVDGGSGDDRIYGGSGDDRLVGNYGNDSIDGRDGDDVIWGSGGHDTLRGGADNDEIHGHGGNDTIYGGSHGDRIYPGTGNDVVYGEGGMDIIVALGGDYDVIYGGSQWDVFWLDPGDTLYDASTIEAARGYVHRVAAFEAVGSMTPSIALNGPDLPDPALLSWTFPSWADFRANPLFPSAGITYQDVDQNDVGDCYFLSILAALAYQQPEEIRKMVTSLGDGTYAVRFFDGGTPRYVRVDADLPVNVMGTPVYAGLGTEGAIWGPLVEKAYAVFRQGTNDYADIVAGNSTAPGHLGGWSWSFYATGPDAGDVRMWDQAGRPPGWIADEIRDGVTAMLLDADARLASGKPLYTKSISGASDTTALTSNNFQRGQHLVAVLSIEKDDDGNPTGLVLYDQRSPNATQTLNDFAQIYYLYGMIRGQYFTWSPP